jgi:hypothetical protein
MQLIYLSLLEWQLLLGTAERNIKAWDVEAKRVVHDLTTEAMFPRSDSLLILLVFQDLLRDCSPPYLCYQA